MPGQGSPTRFNAPAAPAAERPAVDAPCRGLTLAPAFPDSAVPGAGSREPGAGSREPGAGSREPGAPLAQGLTHGPSGAALRTRAAFIGNARRTAARRSRGQALM